MSTDWVRSWCNRPRVVLAAPGFPDATHPAEADIFARHVGVPGIDQERLGRAHLMIVGSGGLGGWTALGLARSGIGQITLIDPDRFDRTNAPRQLVYGADLGEYKAVAVAKNLMPHMIAGGQITAVAEAFVPEMLDGPGNQGDLVFVGVDNNQCRLEASRAARRRHIPAVFAMLSADGMRMQHFVQGSEDSDPCLWCCLPNLDPAGGAICAAGAISSCLASAGVSVHLVHRALTDQVAPNWHEDDLSGGVPSSRGTVARRPDCPVCKPMD